jgi:hypothetical protein
MSTTGLVTMIFYAKFLIANALLNIFTKVILQPKDDFPARFQELFYLFEHFKNYCLLIKTSQLTIGFRY